MQRATQDDHVTDQARAQLQAVFARVGPSMGFTSEAIEVFVRTATLANFKAGTSIVSGTDRDVLLYFLVDGAVRVTCNSPRHALTVEFVSPGRFFGLGSLFDPPGPRCLGAIAHTACLVAMIKPETAAQAIAALPSCGALQMLAYSWRGLSRLIYRKSRTVVMSMRERVLAELRVLARDFGRPTEDGLRIEIPLTASDLATLVGGTRSTTTRAMMRLQQQGIVAREGHRFVLLDPSMSNTRFALSAPDGAEPAFAPGTDLLQTTRPASAVER